MSKKFDWRMVLLFIALLCVTVGCASNVKGASSDKVIVKAEKRAEKGKAKKSYYGALRVKGTYLTDQKGKKVVLKGISTHGLQWFPEYVNEKTFRDLHDTFHMNLVRLALYTDENGYCSGGDKKELEKVIDRGVKAATKHQMYVIIDWHVLHDLTPKKYEKQAKSFFKKMAKKYRKNPHVIYEICNEPNGGTGWEEIRSYAKKIIPVIHKYNKNAVVLVGTPNWSQELLDAAKNPLPKTGKYKNVMYTLHFYATTHRDELRTKLKQAHEQKLPVFVSEFGICDASGNGSIDKQQANQWMALLNQYKISYANWSLCNKDEAASFLKPSCKKLYGFKTSDLSTSGKWLTKVLTGSGKVTAKTEDGKDNKKGETEPGEQEKPNTEVITSMKADAHLLVKAKVTGEWESNGKQFLQYSLSLRNDGSKDIKDWQVKLSFKTKVKIVNHWNGNAQVNGKTITLTPVDYNRTAASGSSIEDIGLIICYEKRP
jgi:endoglucanase